MTKRNQLVDMLKGYACFLVVFGHVIMGVRKSAVGTIPDIALPIEEFIWTFHVALFMFLSGYVYHLNGDWKSKETVGNFVKYKLFNLGVPYLIFSSVYILINSFMSSSVNNAFEITDILYLWKKPVAQYWFIFALFWLFVIFAISGKWLKNWQITLLLCIVEITISTFHIRVGFLGTALSMSLMFGLGASINSIEFSNMKWYTHIGMIIFHVISVVLLMQTVLDSLWIGNQVEACIGIVGSIALISLLSYFKVIKNLLLWICRFSFPIYLLHTIFTAGIRIVLLKVGVENYGIHVITGLVIGILIPYIVACITNKFKILDFFFYPSRTFRILKKNG